MIQTGNVIIPMEIEGRKVVAGFFPTEELRNKKHECHDLAGAYAIVEDEEATFGIIIYGLYKGRGWEPNGVSARIFVRLLMGLKINVDLKGYGNFFYYKDNKRIC